MYKPRPAQRKILNYTGGKMGVSAVPGSGKTWTLSMLAANLIKQGGLEDDQEILIVTLVNSAVDNFSTRIGENIRELGLLPQMGYRVRTLHGLARDIIRQRPDLVNLPEQFEIIDERAGNEILSDVCRNFISANPHSLEEYLLPDLEENRVEWLRREHLPDFLQTIAAAFIKRAKDLRLSPEVLREKLNTQPAALPLAEMGTAIYQDYQRSLAYRGAVDFDDLISKALDALETDPELLSRLRYQWPYILEDEAQDSSRIQEQILTKVAGETGNWVRVGDPNQAIYETFTTADPKYLRAFMASRDVISLNLPNSGRSTKSIITLANNLIQWVQSNHPIPELREALTPPLIQPAPKGDPQPNPDDSFTQIYLGANRFTPQEEIDTIAASLERYLSDETNQDKTIAVLVPRNMRGFHMIEALRKRKIEVVEMLRSTDSTRRTAGALAIVLNYLSDPKSPGRLARVYEVWRREDREDNEASTAVKFVRDLLKTCQHVETYLWPVPAANWLETLELESTDQWVIQQLIEFREIIQRWQEATVLPISQLVLTLAQDLFTEPSELALAHKLALLLKKAGDDHSEWRLPEITGELGVIAKNERRFIGFSTDDTNFNPENHRGKVIITTMHKAKGLEWDRVYLTSVNNYDFPSAQSYDQYIAEKWFIRDRLDIQAETLAQLETLSEDDLYGWYEEGKASHESRLTYAAERLRLLFVGITRARKELIVTWNSGRKSDLQPAIPLTALQAIYEQQQNNQ